MRRQRTFGLMRMDSMRHTLPVLIVCFLLSEISSAENHTNAVDDDSAVFRWRLQAAVAMPARWQLPPADLDIDWPRSNGRWQERGWGFALPFNKAEHRVTVTNLTSDGVSLTATMAVEIGFDGYSGGGFAQYQVSADLASGQGHYRGEWDGTPVSGSLTITPIDGVPRVADWQAPVGASHPRLLLRSDRKPALRERAATAWGQRAAARLRALSLPAWWTFGYPMVIPSVRCFLGDDPAAVGFMQRTVSKSIGAVEHRMLENAGLVTGMALAYDAVYDQLDSVTQNEATQWLLRWSRMCVPGGGEGWNPTPWSNWQVKVRSAGGMAALAIEGDRCDALPRPVDRPYVSVAGVAGDDGSHSTVLGQQSLRSGWRLTDVVAAAEWSDDQLANYAAAAATADSQPDAGLIPASDLGESRGRPVVNPALFPEQQFRGAVAVFVQDVQVTEPSFVAINRSASVALVINGAPIDDDLVRLGAGRHRVVVAIDNRRLPPFVKTVPLILPAFSLEPVQVGAMDEWRHFERGRVAAGGHVPALPDLYRRHQRAVSRWCATALGAGGWNHEGEGYTSFSLRTALPFVAGARHMRGERLDTTNRLIQRYRLLAARGYPWLPSRGRAAFGVGDGNAEDAPLEAALLAGLIDEPVDRAWLVHFATGGIQLDAAGAWVDQIEPAVLAALLLIDADIIAEQQLVQPLPTTWSDHDYGAIVWRNGYGPITDTVLTQFFTKSTPRRAAWQTPEAGAVRVQALGHLWIGRGPVPKAGDRRLDSVPQFPAMVSPGLGAALEVAPTAQATGGGAAVTLDVLYRPRQQDRQVLDMLSQLQDDVLGAPRLHHRRAIAVAHATAGAAGVWGLVDAVSGETAGGVWQLAVNGTVAVRPGGFSLKHEGAVLHATLLSHPNQTPVISDGLLQLPTDRSVFCVWTIAETAVPVPAVHGQGLAAEARFVDGTVVRYRDGQVEIQLPR